VPVKQKPEDVSLDDKIAFLMKINEAALKVPGVIRVQSNMAFDYEWKYLATSEGSYIEQEIWRTSPGFTVTALKNGKSKSRTFSVAPKDRRLRSRSSTRRCSRTSSASPTKPSSIARRRRLGSASRT
jgi:predicted Zn-dependent protease